MFCGGAKPKRTLIKSWGNDVQSATALRHRISPIHNLQMGHEKISNFIQKFEVYCTQEHGIQVCHEAQFRDMIGALGNFFIGERIFKVVLQLSLENEAKVAGESRKYIRGAGPPLLAMWRGDIRQPMHADY